MLLALNAQAQLDLAKKMTDYSTIISTSASSLFVGFLYWILPIVGFWYLFEKKGEAGWKTIIPFYGSYMQYKLFFKTGKWWRMFFLGIFFFVAVIMVGVGAVMYDQTHTDGAAFIVLGGFLLMFIVIIWMLIIAIQFDISICKKYGRGFFFTLGMIFFMPIFIGILAYEVFRGRAKEVE